MNIFYLLLAMTFSAMITIGGRFYNKRSATYSDVARFYSMLVPFFASLGWLLLWVFDFSFDVGILPYSFLYGIGYVAFTVGMLGALKNGSTSLTGLIKQISLVAVSFWGFAFWSTPFTLLTGIGILLTILSLFLCLAKKKGEESFLHIGKWAFYVSLVALGNANCSIVQRYQQMAFDYQHKNAFMFFGVAFATLISLCWALREKKGAWRRVLRESWWCPAIAGLSSAASNLFILLMIREKMSTSVIYPGIAVGGLIITTLIAFFGFKEKLRPTQWGGLGVGALALVLLNI